MNAPTRSGFKQRWVHRSVNPDGTADLHGTDLPFDATEEAWANLTRLAKHAGVPGNLGTIRTDLYTRYLTGAYQNSSDEDIVNDLLARAADPNGPGHPNDDLGTDPEPGTRTSRPQRPRAGFEVRAELSTLIGLDDHPGEVPGSGPLHAFLTRTIVAAQTRGSWRYALTDDHGHLVEEGVIRARPTGTARHVRRRTPTAGLRRHVEIRDRGCVAPGCRMPAMSCDLDHGRDHAMGGLTNAANLAPLCRHDHRLKHDRGWSLTRCAEGSYRWRTPSGLIFDARPPPIIHDLPPPHPRT